VQQYTRQQVDRVRGDRDGGRHRGGNNGGNGGQWNGNNNHDGRDWGSNDHDGRDRGDRGGRDRDWGRNDHDGHNQWANNNNGDWRNDHRRDDHRYNRHRGSHRDFDNPRYRDWRQVRYGSYFDLGYSRIVGSYFHRNYYWWSYGGWHRPHRRWSVGYIFPSYLFWEPVPYDLYYDLPPEPYGCRYVMYDGDILLIVISTGIILDALMYY
jgi:hypothetical protein